jgi:hypothetical protein
MKFEIPGSLKAEHDELHAELVAATRAGGKVSEAAHAVAKALHPHFMKEEEYALPPLGLLAMIADDEFPTDISAVVAMTDKLKKELGQMLHEHKAIVIELHKLMNAAQIEKKPEYLQFAERLKLHARTEEEVLYPAAIMVGEHLKIKLASQERRAS